MATFLFTYDLKPGGDHNQVNTELEDMEAIRLPPTTTWGIVLDYSTATDAGNYLIDRFPIEKLAIARTEDYAKFP